MNKMEKLEFTFINKKGVKQTVVVGDQYLINLYIKGRDFGLRSESLFAKNILNNFGAIFDLIGIFDPIAVTIKDWYHKESSFGNPNHIDKVGFDVYEGEKKIFEFERDCYSGLVNSCMVKARLSRIPFKASDYEFEDQVLTVKYNKGNSAPDMESIKFLKTSGGITFELDGNFEANNEEIKLLMENFLQSFVVPTTTNDLKSLIGSIYNDISQIISLTGNKPSFKLSFNGNFRDDPSLERNITIEFVNGDFNNINVFRIDNNTGEKEVLKLDGKSGAYDYKRDIYYRPYYMASNREFCGYMQIINGQVSLVPHESNTNSWLHAYESSEDRDFDESEGRYLIREAKYIREILEANSRGLGKK